MNKLILRAAKRHLQKADPVMATLVERFIPYAQTNTTDRHPPYYHTLVQAIINQQLSVKAGKTIVERVRRQQGGGYLRAEKLHRLDDSLLRQCGVSANKLRYIRNLSQAVLNGELNFRKMARQDDERVRHTLVQYPGIGPWSADMFLIQAMRRPDILPLGDLVLRKSMQRHYQLANDTDDKEYLSIADAWRPYRTIASQYLWTAS